MKTLTFPFVCLPDAAIWQRIGSHAKILYAALQAYRNRKTGMCNPKLITLAERLGKSLRTIRRALDQLRRTGMVIVRRTLFGNRYELTTPDQWQTTTSCDDIGAKSGRSASATGGLTQRPPVAAQEPDVLEPEGGHAAAAVASAMPEAAAAAAPPPCVSQKPNTPASPPAAPWNDSPEAQTLPAVSDPIPALAQAMAERLLAAPHPNPICRDRAAGELVRILRTAPDVEATAERIWNNHSAWMEEWKTQPHLKTPQLWAWLQWGHWENPPIIRRPAGREGLADQAIARWRERIARGERPF